MLTSVALSVASSSLWEFLYFCFGVFFLRNIFFDSWLFSFSFFCRLLSMEFRGISPIHDGRFYCLRYLLLVMLLVLTSVGLLIPARSFLIRWSRSSRGFPYIDSSFISLLFQASLPFGHRGTSMLVVHRCLAIFCVRRSPTPYALVAFSIASGRLARTSRYL